MNETQTLAQFIADTDYETLPSPVVEAAKIAILDGVANMVAGSVQELADIIGRYVRDSGGASQSSVVGWGYRTNPPAAAFANGVFGHCLDYEIQGFPPTHGTSPACLPPWPWPNTTTPRAGRSSPPTSGLGNPGTPAGGVGPGHRSRPPSAGPGGSLGGAAASAKALGLDAGLTLMALGIAASRTGGLTANTGTMVKSTHPGQRRPHGRRVRYPGQHGLHRQRQRPGVSRWIRRRPFRGKLQLGRGHRQPGRFVAIDRSRL